jgi:hypothetical protein
MSFCIHAKEITKRNSFIELPISHFFNHEFFEILQRALTREHSERPRSAISAYPLSGCRGNAQAAQFRNRGSASIVPNEKPRYWAGLEVGGFPSGTSTSFLKKVRMRSRCEAAMS